jgi:hypothetical protein
MTRARGVILDVDGTLVDSAGAVGTALWYRNLPPKWPVSG